MAVAKDLANGAEPPGTAAVGHEEGSVRAVVEAPLVGAAVGVDFEFVGDWVESPDGGVYPESLFFRSARFADEGGIEDAMAAIKPAVMSPEEGVGSFVGVVDGESIEEDLGRAIRFVIAIGIGDEKKLRCAGDEDPSVSHFKTAHEVEVVRKNLVAFEGSIVVLVFEDHEAVVRLAICPSSWVGECFRDPDSSAAVKGEGDGLAKEGLPGDRFNLEPIRDPHPLRGLSFLARRILF